MKDVTAIGSVRCDSEQEQQGGQEAMHGQAMLAVPARRVNCFLRPRAGPRTFAHMRVLLLSFALAFIGCQAPAPVSATPDAAADVTACTVLFGAPNDKTGLTAAQCQPQCTCGGKDFTPPTYTDADADALLAWQLANPPTQVTDDPYAHPEAHVPAHDKVCAFVRGAGKAYTLQTFASADAAQAAGAVMTHNDACGVCSPLTDLAVYMRHPDLTDPVRQCGLVTGSGMKTAKDEAIACLQALGFDLPCAQIWYFNTLNTRAHCLDVCLANFSAPYHNPDGTLNDCLLCDEQQSGDVFKAVAGRTRRNTGLPSSMCRPCAEVVPLLHVYP